MRFGPIGGSGIDSASSDSCGRRSSAVGAGICSLCCTSAYVLNVILGLTLSLFVTLGHFNGAWFQFFGFLQAVNILLCG
jgi:hypothetical protein